MCSVHGPLKSRRKNDAKSDLDRLLHRACIDCLKIFSNVQFNENSAVIVSQASAPIERKIEMIKYILSKIRIEKDILRDLVHNIPKEDLMFLVSKLPYSMSSEVYFIANKKYDHLQSFLYINSIWSIMHRRKLPREIVHYMIKYAFL